MTCEPRDPIFTTTEGHSQQSARCPPRASGLCSASGGPGSHQPVFSRTTARRTRGAPPRPARPSAARPTSAHGAVLPQGVAGRAGAHVGALGVAAAEGAEQGVQGALVHVCGGQSRCLLGRVGLRAARPRPQAGPRRPPPRSPAPGRQGLPSQVIRGPGSKPSAQAHSKPPMTLVQVPSPQGCPTEHSSVSGGGGRGQSGPAGGLPSSTFRECPVRPPPTAAATQGQARGPSGPDAGQAGAGCRPAGTDGLSARGSE